MGPVKTDSCHQTPLIQMLIWTGPAGGGACGAGPGGPSGYALTAGCGPCKRQAHRNRQGNCKHTKFAMSMCDGHGARPQQQRSRASHTMTECRYCAELAKMDLVDVDADAVESNIVLFHLKPEAPPVIDVLTHLKAAGFLVSGMKGEFPSYSTFRKLLCPYMHCAGCRCCRHCIQSPRRDSFRLQAASAL